MLVLLPPSEGKSADVRGTPFDPASLSFPDLAESRQEILDALIRLCAGPMDKALEVLSLSARQAGEVARNRELRTADTMPAAEIYTGVLYDALDLAGLPHDAAARAARSVVIFSGLWGALRLTDRIPPYRLSMGVKLPGLGALAKVWRTPLGKALHLETDGQLICDLRSTAYAAAWQPAPPAAQQTVAVRVLREQTVSGVPRRSVVSHMNKATKGRIVRDLMCSGADPATPAELAGALAEMGHTVEGPVQDGPAGRTWVLDVVVTDL